MAGGETHVFIEHDGLDIGQGDHRNVGDGRRHADEALLGLKAIVFFVGDVESDLRLAGFDFRDAARSVGHEFDDHRLERRLAAPVIGVGFEAHESVALVFLDHIGAGANRRGFEAFGADLSVIGFRQDIAGQERHPFEQGRIEFLDVAGDDVVGRDEIVDFRPDEIDRIAGLRIGGALQRPDDVFGGERRAVMPGRALAHFHFYFLVVVGPAPFGDEAGRERQIRFLRDILIEHRLIDALDRRVDRRHGPSAGSHDGRLTL